MLDDLKEKLHDTKLHDAKIALHHKKYASHRSWLVPIGYELGMTNNRTQEPNWQAGQLGESLTLHSNPGDSDGC
jgi:hypothetical protein